VPPQTVAKLYTAVQTALAAAEIGKGLVDIGYEPAAISPPELSAFIQREIPKWIRVVREARITPE
jgi:tripartite-type tricarboxylate transporter receptor subunit TctC